MEMRDCKFGWWKERGEGGKEKGGLEKRGSGGGTGGGEGDSKPSGHEMMLKEVKLLESVENEGPEGLRVKVERVGVGVSGCCGARGGVSVPAGPRAVATSCCAGLLGRRPWLVGDPLHGGHGPGARSCTATGKRDQLGSELGSGCSQGAHESPQRQGGTKR